MTVADKTNQDQQELPQLSGRLDPEALNALVRSLDNGEVTFQYAGHEIVVDSNESIKHCEQLSGRASDDNETLDPE